MYMVALGSSGGAEEGPQHSCYPTASPLEATLLDGRYGYTEDLQALENRARVERPTAIAHDLQAIRTPHVVSEWARLPESHPDKGFVEYIVRGITCGFRIGFNPQGCLQNAHSNMQSARDNAEVVDNYLGKECSLHRVVGPLTDRKGIHINRFGVIPKAGHPGK